MAVKAVLITKENQKMLAQRYDADLDYIDEEMPIGYFLVTGFGEEAGIRSHLSEAMLDDLFTRHGALLNGFFEVRRKIV